MSFNSLTSRQKMAFYNNLIRGIRAYTTRPRYESVTDEAEDPRRVQVAVETRGEDGALSHYEYFRLVALSRHMARNAETLDSMLRQMEQNCIGTIGGKAIFNFGAAKRDVAAKMRDRFGDWASTCEYFEEVNLGEIMRLALRSRLVTGRAVLMHDNGLIRDSGRILLFEGDSIANVSNAEFASRFPDGWSQNRGIIKDNWGCTRGCIVSSSQRGKEVFDITDSQGRPAVFFLVRADNERRLDAPFAMYQSRKRANQYVCVPEFASSLGSIADLEDACKYELAAAKKHAQTIATIEQSVDDRPSLSDGLALPPVLDNNSSDEDVASAEDSAMINAAAEEPLSLPEIERATGVFYEVLPPGLKMQLLDTKHPNANMSEFVRWIEGRVGWSQGLASVYASGKADSSYSASRAEQVLTWPMFESEQKKLEVEICDWILRRWYDRALRIGELDDIRAELPADWMRRVQWQWPRMREIDAKAEQEVIAAKLRNGSGSYAELYGADWSDRIDQIADEIKYCRERGVPHAMIQSVSGQLFSETEVKDEINESEV